MRVAGLSVRSLHTRSTPCSSIAVLVEKNCRTLPTIFRPISGLTPSKPGNSLHPGQLSSSGVPHNSQILSNWSRSLLPHKIGRRVHISPIIHPTPHISIAHPYRASPIKSSGGRYHRVTTQFVYRAPPPPREGPPLRGSHCGISGVRGSQPGLVVLYGLARPKSAIWRDPWLLIRRLAALRSRWRILFLCKYSVPSNSCLI